MKYILDQKQMKTLDKHSVTKLQISEIYLMEQAASAVVEEIDDRYSVDHRVLVVVEGGNNGGDGLAIARLLTDKGYDVCCYNVGQIKKVSPSFTEQLRLANEHGVIVYDSIPASESFDIVIDSIFGIGLKRQIKGEHAKVIEWMNRLDAIKIAVDTPSGVHSTTGEIMGCAFKADITVTFGYMKLGLTMYPGADLAGLVVVRNIGFPEEALIYAKPTYITYGSGKAAVMNSMKYFPKRANRTNKGDYGHVFMIVGSEGMAGAAVLACKCAYKSGCGLVRILTVSSNRDIILSLIPEAIVYTYDDIDEAYRIIDENWAWADAVLIGCGLSRSDIAVDITRAVVTYATASSPKKQVIIDGDSLYILGNNKDILERYKKLDPNLRCYLTLTPHLKEMSYLSKMPVSVIRDDMFKAVKSYINDSELKGYVTVVLKDARTVISTGAGLSYINMTGNHGMATAGSGDCLAGMMASIIAQGVTRPSDSDDNKSHTSENLLPDFENLWIRLATVACCLHGAAGDFAVNKRGTIALTASDIVDFIPEVMKYYDELH